MNTEVIESLTHYAQLCLSMAEVLDNATYRDTQRERAFNVADYLYRNMIEAHIDMPSDWDDEPGEIQDEPEPFTEMREAVAQHFLPPPGDQQLQAQPNAADGDSLVVPERNLPHPPGAEQSGAVICAMCRARLEHMGALAEHIRTTHPPTE